MPAHVSWVAMAKKSLRKKRAAKKGKPESPAAALARQKHKKMTPEERSEHARRMSEARWRKTPRKEE